VFAPYVAVLKGTSETHPEAAPLKYRALPKRPVARVAVMEPGYAGTTASAWSSHLLRRGTNGPRGPSPTLIAQ